MVQVEAARMSMVSGFVQSLQEPRTPYISPKRLSAALGVQVANLADLTGVHRNTLRNLSSERVQSKLREMVKVITAAAALTSDLSKAIYWFRNEPISDYYQRPRPSWWRKVMSKPYSAICATWKTGRADENHPARTGRGFPSLPDTEMGVRPAEWARFGK